MVVTHYFFVFIPKFGGRWPQFEFDYHIFRMGGSTTWNWIFGSIFLVNERWFYWAIELIHHFTTVLEWKSISGLCMLMSKWAAWITIFRILNDLHMSNKEGVEHQPVFLVVRNVIFFDTCFDLFSCFFLTDSSTVNVLKLKWRKCKKTHFLEQQEVHFIFLDFVTMAFQFLQKITGKKLGKMKPIWWSDLSDGLKSLTSMFYDVDFSCGFWDCRLLKPKPWDSKDH